ncbi:hypothetical protein PanWU01x14_173110 [Parasponia andersonii]|uniref:Protein PHYTOCHROME KINASE SUBSTRATE n=1 Tax=Parasponia andersonii TaxID=3476 RepID=A0A2P5C9B8_PARAD|nr:hypothetical protein PanWU01x14_173110 [Parasponia andersonii]
MNMVTLTSARSSEAPFSPHLTSQEKHTQLGRKKEDQDDEIGVFRAEKYFNGVIDHDETSSRISGISSARSYTPYKNDDQIQTVIADLEQIKSKIQPRTPSVRSESSWNSRSMLLQSSSSSSSALKNSSRTKRSKINGKKLLSDLGCKCSCSDKNSVDTKDVGEISFNKSSSSNIGTTNPSYGGVLRKPSIVSPVRPGVDLIDAINQINTAPKMEAKVMGSGFLRRESFSTFPNTKSPSGLPRNAPLLMKSPFQGMSPEILCKSPEVFGSSSSPALEKGNKTMSLERRLTMMSWDHHATPRPEELVFGAANSGAGVVAHHHHDSGSDASSDLFEIDSLTGKTNPFRARRPSDDTASGCMTPTHGYAPSEASIQWSVVTASQADFSVISDCEETITTSVKPQTTSKMVSSAKARILDRDREIMQQRRRSSSTSASLLGCKNHKAVNVAGDVYRASPKTSCDADHARFMRSESPARFQAEITKLTDFNSRVGQHSLPTHSPIPRSHSPRNSHMLYIQ